MDNQAVLAKKIKEYENIEAELLSLSKLKARTYEEIRTQAKPPFAEGEEYLFLKYPEWLMFLDVHHQQYYHQLAVTKGILYQYYSNDMLDNKKIKVLSCNILSFKSERNNISWEINIGYGIDSTFFGIFSQPINPFIKVKAQLTKDNLVALIMRAYLEGEKGLDYYLTLNKNNYFEVVRVNLEQEPEEPEWGTLFKIVLDFPEDLQGNLHKQIYGENFTIYGGNTFEDKLTVKELIKYYQMAP